MSKRLTTEEFIDRARKIHGDKFDYSQTIYTNAKTKVKIKCKKHGIFEQTPEHHINRKDGCPICRNKQNGRSKRLNIEDIISRASIANNHTYNYSITTYSTYHDKIKFICPIHGVVEQYVKHHLNGVGCPLCRESKGEQKIRLYLDSNNISYIREYKFKNCVDIKPLPFDFYLPHHNICIEFDGEQHYTPARYSKNKKIMIDKLHNIQKHDNIKSQYCMNNNIHLIRIQYWDINNIESILCVI